MKKKKLILACDTPPYIVAEHAQQMVNCEFRLSQLNAALHFLENIPNVDGIPSIITKIKLIKLKIYSKQENDRRRLLQSVPTNE